MCSAPGFNPPKCPHFLAVVLTLVHLNISHWQKQSRDSCPDKHVTEKLLSGRKTPILISVAIKIPFAKLKPLDAYDPHSSLSPSLFCNGQKLKLYSYFRCHGGYPGLFPCSTGGAENPDGHDLHRTDATGVHDTLYQVRLGECFYILMMYRLNIPFFSGCFS